MPDKYRLRYLPAVQNDLVEIFDFIAQDSPTRASLFVENLDKRIGRLEQHPLLGRIPRDPNLRVFGYRILIVESYHVLYIIRGQTIEIHRVLHGSRNLDLLI